MALIKCPECSKEVSDRASSCPNCGCPVTKNELDNELICSKCGVINPNDRTYCVHCGHIFSSKEYRQYDMQIKSYRNLKLGLGIVGIVLSLIMIVTGISLFYFGRTILGLLVGLVVLITALIETINNKNKRKSIMQIICGGYLLSIMICITELPLLTVWFVCNIILAIINFYILMVE